MALKRPLTSHKSMGIAPGDFREVAGVYPPPPGSPCLKPSIFTG